MFGFIFTNRALRSRLRANDVRFVFLNAEINNLRNENVRQRAMYERMLENHRKEKEQLMDQIDSMRPMQVRPSIPRPALSPGRVIDMPTRAVPQGSPIIDHGSSSSNLSDMMLAGIISTTFDGPTYEDKVEAKEFSSGRGGDFGGGGATSSWDSDSSSSSSSSCSSDSSSSSDSGSSSSD